MDLSGVLNPNRISLYERERHIDDYKKGRAENSISTAHRLGSLDRETSKQLAETDPDNFRKFSAYASVMSYGRRARFVSNVSDQLAQVRKINMAA